MEASTVHRSGARWCSAAQDTVRARLPACSSNFGTQAVVGQIERDPSPARAPAFKRRTAGPTQQPGPANGYGSQGDEDAGESSERRLDLTHVVEKRRGDDFLSRMTGPEKSDRGPGHSHGMASVGSGHPSPERLFTVEQVIERPVLVGWRWTDGQQSREESPGQVAP